MAETTKEDGTIAIPFYELTEEHVGKYITFQAIYEEARAISLAHGWDFKEGDDIMEIEGVIDSVTRSEEGRVTLGVATEGDYKDVEEWEEREIANSPVQIREVPESYREVARMRLRFRNTGSFMEPKQNLGRHTIVQANELGEEHVGKYVSWTSPIEWEDYSEHIEGILASAHRADRYYHAVDVVTSPDDYELRRGTGRGVWREQVSVYEYIPEEFQIVSDNALKAPRNHWIA